MAVGLVISPGTRIVPSLPFVAMMARECCDSIFVFWPQRRSEESEGAIVPTHGDDCPAELASIFDALRKLGFSDAPETNGAPNLEQVDTVEKSAPTLRCTAIACGGSSWSQAVLDQLGTHKITRLVIPRPQDLQHTSSEFEEFRNLATEATCEVVQLRAVDPTVTEEGEIPTSQNSDLSLLEQTLLGSDRPLRILVATAPGPSAELALSRAYDWAETVPCELTAVHIAANIDEAAAEVGEKVATQIVRRTLGSHADAFETRVVLGNDVDQGIAEISAEYDLLVLGTQNHGFVHRLLHRGVPQELLRKAACPAVAVIRPPTSLTSRVAKSFNRFIQDVVPQLVRDRRVSLVDQIQSSSKWDVDFIALISLSTLIATCGLLQGSTAVVIGAMLVAPLMTPLLGAGLSLVQGNSILFGNALRSVLRGFLLALGLAITIGCLAKAFSTTPDAANLITDEIAARGSPRLLDLIVAFVSGIAAAYATSRPKLVSALPGVAIASALVPPIGTIGLGIAWAQWQLALGAGMLFLTNIVAIVLGTAASFFAVGVRGKHAHSFLNSGTHKTILALILVLIGLGIVESLPARRVPPPMMERIVGYFDGQRSIRLESVNWKNPDSDILQVHVTSASPLLPSVGRDVATLTNQVTDRPVRIEIHTVLLSFHNPPSNDARRDRSSATIGGRD